MMIELKKGIKMIRYAYGIKSNCLQAGIFFLLGVVMLAFREQGDFGLVGGFFCISIGMLPLQVLYSLSVSNMVLASPMRKKMQTIVPVSVNLASIVLIYLAEALLCGLMARKRPQQAGELYLDLVILAIVAVFMMVYMGICYKYFVLATLIVAPALTFLMWGSLGSWLKLRLLGVDITFGAAVLAGLGMIAMGGLAEYLLTLLFYKVPMAKMAQAVPLRKGL